MSKENTFNTEEDFKIGKIIKEAFTMKDKEERALFIEDECDGNLIMIECIRKYLEEMDDGEKGFEDLSLRSDTEVGNYVIIEKINQGGIASVYSAAHKDLKTLAAIKVFDKLDGESRENDLFWNTDYSSLSKFNHDNIVKLYDVGSYEKNGKKLRYIAVEYVKGKHFDEHCKSKKMSVREVLQLFQDLCEVIEFIHDEKKIIHLDLKPSNILVTADHSHRIKLIDFGSSKPNESESKLFTRFDLLNPKTLKYAPPEQYDHNEVLTPKSDIYSLGVIFYLIITGKLPFGEEEKDREKITREVTDKNLMPVLPSERVFELNDETKFGVPLKTLNEILSGDLDCIIMKALKKRRPDRYQSVSELRHDIDNFLKGKPVKARKMTPGYTIIKSVSQFLGFKGGLIGWDKWKTPLKRLSVFASILTLLSFIGANIYIYLDPSSSPSAKRIEKPKMSYIRAYNDMGIPAYLEKSNVDIYCGPKESENICFTFVEIPIGQFEMGRYPTEKYKSIFESVENKSTGSKKVSDVLEKSSLIKTEGDSSEPDTETSFIVDYEAAASPLRFIDIEKKFYMAKFEVTNKQWNIVANIKKVKTELKFTNDDNELPKTNISYSEAIEFCARLSADLESQSKRKIKIRLPSEAEWEYACRAKSLRSLSEIKNLRDFVNAIIIKDEKPPQWAEWLLKNTNTPLPESSLFANSYGLVAMNGNVWEIVSDEWRDKYDDTQSKGEPWGNVLNNSVPDEKKKYVLRGGAYNTETFMTQCSYRKDEKFLFVGNDQIGFRIVMESEGLD